MITAFRAFSKSKWAAALLILIAISFVVVGSQMDIFGSLGPKHVIEAGSRSVNPSEFRNEFDRIRERAQEQEGRAVTYEEIADSGLLARYLEGQTQQLGFLSWAWKAGIRPGKELIIKQIRAVPAFFNQVTNQFDQTAYQTALAQQGMTPAMLEQDLRDQYALQHYVSAMQAGARAPAIYGAMLAGQAMERRDGRWFEISSSMVPAVGAPNEDQLKAFMQENAERLRSPEFRTVSVVLFTPDAASANAAIPDERIRERFEFRKDTLGRPETRTFTTLTAPNREIAQRIATSLRAGQSAAEVGRANNIQPADYAAAPKAAIGDQAVANAVFGMQANAVSDPVQAGVGFAVIKLDSVQAPQVATLEGSREQIVQELREEDRKGQTYAKVEAYEKARQEGKNLVDATSAAGARIVQLPPATRDGRLPNGQPLNAPATVFETAWNLTKGGESDVIDAGQGQYFAVRLDDVRPAELPSLDEVRPMLAQEWVRRETMRRVSAKAEELAARVRNGEDIAAVAASVNATLTARTAVVRDQQSTQALGQTVMQGLFGQARGQAFVLPAQSGYVVGRVDAIQAADVAAAAPLAAQVRPRLGQQLAESATETAVTNAAQRARAKNDMATARQALGLNPASGAPAAPAQ